GAPAEAPHWAVQRTENGTRRTPRRPGRGQQFRICRAHACGKLFPRGAWKRANGLLIERMRRLHSGLSPNLGLESIRRSIHQDMQPTTALSSRYHGLIKSRPWVGFDEPTRRRRQPMANGGRSPRRQLIYWLTSPRNDGTAQSQADCGFYEAHELRFCTSS